MNVEVLGDDIMYGGSMVELMNKVKDAAIAASNAAITGAGSNIVDQMTPTEKSQTGAITGGGIPMNAASCSNMITYLMIGGATLVGLIIVLKLRKRKRKK
jgi:fructose-specific phosphotransferase system IIC component